MDKIRLHRELLKRANEIANDKSQDKHNEAYNNGYAHGLLQEQDDYEAKILILEEELKKEKETYDMLAKDYDIMRRSAQKSGALDNLSVTVNGERYKII